jgi:hypothetical protein
MRERRNAKRRYYTSAGRGGPSCEPFYTDDLKPAAAVTLGPRPPAAGLNWEVELITLAYDRRTVGHLPVWSELCFDSVIVLKWERTRAKAQADSR